MAKGKGFIAEFKKFIMRGNVIDLLAVGHILPHKADICIGRQIFAGEQRVFEQIAHQHAQIGFRKGKLVGQIQIPVNGNLLLRSPERIIARDSVHGGVRA